MAIKTGEKMVATDITDLTFFPKGTILTFSSEAWDSTSAEFKEIWKICNASNHEANPAIPDLTDKFLRGAESSGATGDGKKTLSVSELPEHNHPNGTLAASGGEHTHGVNDPGHSHPCPAHHDEAANNSANFTWGGSPASTNLYTGSKTTGITVKTDNSAHSHSISGAIGDTGSGAEFDVIPAFYTVIYIMKVA